MDTKRQIWEQEIYYEMKYRKSDSCFHTFEAEESMVGLYFADEGEGEHFFFTINDRLSKMLNRENRRIVRQQSRSAQPPREQVSDQSPMLRPDIPTSSERVKSNPIMDLVSPMVPKKKKAKKDKKPKLSKADIGKPTNFVHAQGIKSGPSGFQQVDNTVNYDEELRKFLSHAGISPTVLQDPEKKKEVMDFAEKNQVVQKMTVRRKKPAGTAPSAKPPPPPPSKPSTSAPKMSGAPPPPPPPPPPPIQESVIERKTVGAKGASEKGNVRSKPGSR